ncbi:lipopolysaccharide biosynthesis protein [Parenemella sanctibonifatiensis]|uniref:Lipopolysaccharide biosynthesis protein n=1 Tax=Parenemella sanctibonifatiensis TaxID=2016505 RepID=A0A255EL79_9ACTN|nr:hypothetical protein [Parenemella sanctibonifatiensis]OYN92289.1 hypothetical protein CGZ91_01930 [Parenemella sanctibonifatiensis]
MAKRGAMLVTLGIASSSLVRWYLIWLFARTEGGAAAVAEYGFVLALFTPIFVLCQMGLRTIFLSASVRWPWHTYVRLRWLGCVIGVVIVVGLTWLVPMISWEMGLPMAALKVTSSLSDLQLGRVQYGNRMAKQGQILIVSAIGTAVGATVLVVLTGLGWTGVAMSAVMSLVSAVWARSNGRSVPYEHDAVDGAVSNILKGGMFAAGSQALASLLFQIPVLVLGIIASPVDTGVFTAAAYLLTAAALLGSTMQTIIITPLRRRRDESGTQFLKSYSARLTRRAALAAVPLVALVALVGDPVLRLVYGPEFGMDWTSLLLIGVGAASIVVAYIQDVTLQVLNRYGSVTAAVAMACIASIAVGGLMILLGSPHVLVGAAMAAAGGMTRFAVMAVVVRRQIATVDDATQG